MWLSERAGRGRAVAKSADIGDVTIADERTGVMLDGEQRSLGLCFPGGYAWRPRKGQSVVVIKSADGECLVAGLPQNTAPAALNPGEVRVSADGGAEIKLTDGIALRGKRIDLFGELYINGVKYSP